MKVFDIDEHKKLLTKYTDDLRHVSRGLLTYQNKMLHLGNNHSRENIITYSDYYFQNIFHINQDADLAERVLNDTLHALSIILELYHGVHLTKCGYQCLRNDVLNAQFDVCGYYNSTDSDFFREEPHANRNNILAKIDIDDNIPIYQVIYRLLILSSAIGTDEYINTKTLLVKNPSNGLKNLMMIQIRQCADSIDKIWNNLIIKMGLE